MSGEGRSDRPCVLATDRMAGFRTADGEPVLAPLLARTECEVWPGPGAIGAEALRSRIGAAEGLLCLLTDRIDAELLVEARKLRVISTVSVGVDHIDVEAARRRGIVIGHTPGVLTETTADLAFALMLAAARRVVESDVFLRAGRWRAEERWSPDMFAGRDVHGATLGIVGLGPIGQAMARRASGFGMQVLGWSRTPRDLPGVQAVRLDELLARSDFVSIHVALCEATRGLIGAEQLARMRPDAVLINTARGGVLDEAALASALRGGRLGAAALDVFAREPIAPDDPLIGLPNVVLTPHIGSASLATRTRMVELAVANLLAGLEGRPMPAPLGAD